MDMKKITFVVVVLLVAVASCSKNAKPDVAKALDGAKLFAGNCARCHGAQGIKDERMPNLQTVALDKTGLTEIITKGKGHMPSFEDKLSAAEISAVADLIVGWHKK